MEDTKQEPIYDCFKIRVTPPPPPITTTTFSVDSELEE